MTCPARGVLAGALALALAVTLTACSGDRHADEAGARAAAQAYVDALAAGDLATVEGMTDPDAVDVGSYADDVDIGSALPSVVDSIEDPWVALVSPTGRGTDGPVEYAVEVSYEIRGATGGGTIAVELDDDGDPDDPASWTVTTPLVESLLTYTDTRIVPVALIGDVEVDYTVSDGRTVWGYPGGYLLETPEPVRGVAPVTIVIGASDLDLLNGGQPGLARREDG
ncbi:hypothetical protein [Nocardioides sp.]|uniref:hypothetical protein n=1 Tax=Nocardioides sp. TaxID=35761 RepID=UPI002727E47E|nr:hypothetical protein [Nocardioides sp.]MDO9456800.1 hypothetical protein [Nocardioides sp.]